MPNPVSGFYFIFYFRFYLFIYLFIYFSLQCYTRDIWRFPGQGLNQSCSCHPAPQPQQHVTPDQLREARDQTHILMDTSWLHFHCATMRTPYFSLFDHSCSIWKISGQGLNSHHSSNPRYNSEKCQILNPLSYQKIPVSGFSRRNDFSSVLLQQRV